MTKPAQAVVNFFVGQSIASQLIARNAPAAQPVFNFSTKKVGGLRFVKIGRLSVSFAITRTYKPL